MNKIKTISTAALFCSAIAFTACNNNHSSENPDKNITTTSDTTSQASRDSVSRRTTVTPSTSSATPNP